MHLTCKTFQLNDILLQIFCGISYLDFYLFFPQTFLQTNKSHVNLSFCPIHVPLTALIEPFASCQPLFCTLSHAVCSSPAVLLNLQNIKLISLLMNDQFYKLGYAACTYLSINSSTCHMYCTYQDGVSKHESHIFTCPVHNQNINFQGKISLNMPNDYSWMN